MKLKRLSPDVLASLGYQKTPHLPRPVGEGQRPDRTRMRELRDALRDETARADRAEKIVRDLRSEVERLKRFVRELQS